MILQFQRFENEISLDNDHVTTLQVEDRLLFSRIVSALVSGDGVEAVEPYQVWDDAGKKVAASKALLILNSLPTLPLNDKTLLKLLYVHIDEMVRDNTSLEDEAGSLSVEMRCLFERMNSELWGTYDFEVDWDAPLFLKAFGYHPMGDSDASLLDKCIQFFELCVDINLNKVLVLVNAKSFFTEDGFNELCAQAFFHRIPLLFVESWNDCITHEWETKMCIDQHYLEF